MMRGFAVLFLSLVAVPVTVSACEGDCIVGVTSAFLDKYNQPVGQTMMNLANEISQLLPDSPTAESTMQFLQPITQTYANRSYDGMEHAIFPSFFHGKCLDSKGREPDGCPNPDCPLVCGTPGSLVHFYGKLRYIAYNQTRYLLKELCTPGSDTYDQVERAVVNRVDGKGKRASGFSTVSLLEKRKDDVKAKLKEAMSGVSNSIEQICGGSGLSQCSWEDELKQYILTFP